MSLYPIKKRSNNGVVPRRNNNKNYVVPRNNNGIVPITAGIIPNIFAGTNDKEKYKTGRSHCERIEQTAIYTDANGNRVVLRQNRLIMNGDSDGPGIRYTSGNERMTKKRKY